MPKLKGKGTKESPWQLNTLPGSSAYLLYKEGDVLVCKEGSTTLKYQWRVLPTCTKC